MLTKAIRWYRAQMILAWLALAFGVVNCIGCYRWGVLIIWPFGAVTAICCTVSLLCWLRAKKYLDQLKEFHKQPPI